MATSGTLTLNKILPILGRVPPLVASTGTRKDRQKRQVLALSVEIMAPATEVIADHPFQQLIKVHITSFLA